MARYWLRTIRGLEWIAAFEAALATGRPDITLGHRDVFFESDSFLEPAALRCSDDVFLFWTHLSNLDHTRDTLRRLSLAASNLPAPPTTTVDFRSIHVTASFLGHRNYSRGEIEQVFGESLARAVGLKWEDQLPQNSPALRVRIHLAGDRAAIGIGLTPTPIHRRPWRVHTQKGMLHPPVAASLALLADLRDGLTVHDPFAGSGTVLIEAGLHCPNLMLSGWDLDPNAIQIGMDHAARAGVAVDLQLRDAFVECHRIPAPDRVVSNPPWGRSVVSGGDSAGDPLGVLVDLLSSDGRLVAVADRSMEMADFLDQNGLGPDIAFPIRVSGRIADVAVASADRRGLSDDLASYWKQMQRVPWDGVESRETLEVPSDWGRPISTP
jgi:hypothetical protein